MIYDEDYKHFLEKMCSNLFLPYIALPSRATSRIKTLIDSIFSNVIEDANSCNIITTVSDHFVQFTLFKDKNCSKTEKKAKVYRDFAVVDKEMTSTSKLQTGMKF